MKIWALYLPQYHEIIENNKWWGTGYTEWTAVKSATKLYKSHNQPRIPLNNNYYNLADQSGNVWRWQAGLAKKYGIVGFSIYHYWFNGDMLLEKPAQILLQNKDINLNFYFTWANESWTRTWYGLEKEVLMKQEYGIEKDWVRHFNYLLDFFRDPRYYKIDNKPVIAIYRSGDIENLVEMKNLWNELCISNGFAGIYLISGNTAQSIDNRRNIIDNYYDFEPGFSTKQNLGYIEKQLYNLKIVALILINFLINRKSVSRKINSIKVYKRIIKRAKEKHSIPGIFPMWDNTPRRSYKGTVYLHTSPKIFGEYLKKLRNILDENDMIIINAWNEWGESCYLEPDETYGYAYLEEIKKACNGDTR